MPLVPGLASIGKSWAISRFLPASSRTTLRPPSVSSLTAHEPEAPEPTTMASYVDSLLLIRACLFSCVRILVAIGSDECLPEGSPAPIANAPQADEILHQISGGRNAFGGFGCVGGNFTGPGDVLRRENPAQVRDQGFPGSCRKAPRHTDFQSFDRSCPM